MLETMKARSIRLLLLVVACYCYGSNGFVLRNTANSRSLTFNKNKKNDPTQQPFQRIRAIKEDQETSSNVNLDEISRLKKEAERMRLEAEQMDIALTLKKIDALEAKLENSDWLAKHPEEENDLKNKLSSLNNKLLKKDNDSAVVSTEKNVPVVASSSSSSTSMATSSSMMSPSKTATEKTSFSRDVPKPKATRDEESSPIAGFDDVDLEKYLPVAKEIDERLPNATLEEKLEAFRSAPELQEHFQAKIQSLLVGPLEDMQRMEKLKQDYLKSTSSVERANIKRELDKLESAVEEDSPYQYSETVYYKDGLILTDEELQKRLDAVGALPAILICLYKQRCGLSEDADLRLAVELDYFEPQLQLIEQVRLMKPIPDDMREDFCKAFDTLPPSVQDHFAKNLGLENGRDPEAVLSKLEDDSIGNTPLSPLIQVVEEVQPQTDFPEYNDVEFVDRSRYLAEFFPSIAKLEEQLPPKEDIDRFAYEILDKKFFMVTSKAERVSGGYYIRGTNLLEGDDAADKLVQKVSETLAASDLADKLDFFYILDPSAPMDEDIELNLTVKPIFVVTAKDDNTLYSPARPLTKLGVSLLGSVTALMFSIGACALNPSIADRYTAALDAVATTGVLDLQWLIDLFSPILFSIFAIQLAHEFGHRIIAWRDKFDIGLPTLLPAIQVGLQGAITPLRSPPPNSKSLFDFAMAGPLAGLTVSILFLLAGLDMTASADFGAQLPVVPVDLLRTSSFVGGMTQYFLGKSAIMPNQGPDAILGLHPYAIAGFVGCITNALALLPLGHTDGGRISVTMFGRRGAFVVKLFVTLLLLAIGIFGLDDANIFLTYVLLVSVWQRELETPCRNEVDELDFPRGLIGAASAFFVALVLVPMF